MLQYNQDTQRTSADHAKNCGKKAKKAATGKKYNRYVGYQSCFYRALEKNSEKNLVFIEEKVYDPEEAYKK